MNRVFMFSALLVLAGLAVAFTLVNHFHGVPGSGAHSVQNLAGGLEWGDIISSR
jgi:hypothetical protein